MKIKHILLALMAFATAMPSEANELTSEQKAFQSSIVSFLREEGFSPSVDEDNSINFKKEGVSYWIDIDESAPFYTELHRSGFSCKTADKDKVIRACNETNRTIKSVKAIMKTTTVSIVLEAFYKTPEEFKYTFYRSIKELDKAYSRCKEEYNKLDDDSGRSSNSSSTSSGGGVRYITGEMTLSEMLAKPMQIGNCDPVNDSFETVMNSLSGVYKVDDNSEKYPYTFYIWERDNSNVAKLTYHGLSFYYFYYYVSKEADSYLKRRMTYKYKINKTQLSSSKQIYSYLDKIVSDYNNLGINLTYEKKRDKYTKAQGEVRYGNKKYSITLSEYSSSWEVDCSCWMY